MSINSSAYVRDFSACALLAVSCLFAQLDHRMIATVPFDFVVSNRHLAAGTYTVTTNLNQGTVLIRGEDNGSAQFTITIATQARKTQEHEKLVFNRYGERYFLRQVWQSGMDRGRELPASKAEQEFARIIGKPEIVSLLVSAPGMRRSAR